jgi:hypothetical protein
MARKFDETVTKVADRIRQGRVILTERVRAGRRRQISVGPYRTATATNQYALCTLPAIHGEHDCKETKSPKRVARDFVRLVGTENAIDALARESRKHGY